MKVLLIGSGGREHALAWKIARSPVMEKLCMVPALCRHRFPDPRKILAVSSERLSAPPDIAAFAHENAVDLVVIGPEAPLAAGAGDMLRKKGIACFGPDRAAARLETSKSFMKEICSAGGIPAAASRSFSTAGEAVEFLKTSSPPYVVKADGLAAGKGVIIAGTLPEAICAVHDMFGGRFGDAGRKVLIEEFLEGEEASFFALADGTDVVPLLAVQDHKRAFDGDRGPNTGGMGAYSPVGIFTGAVLARTMEMIVRPLVSVMKERGTPYTGVIFAGLMIRNGMPRLIEVNARFGDPECQVLMRRMKSDILPLLYAAATGNLAGMTVDWHDSACALVVMASKGYPGTYRTGSVIGNVEKADSLPGVVVFHAGTRTADGKLTAAGGRVLNVTGAGVTVHDAVERAYKGVRTISWPEGHYRTDIAWRASGHDPASG